ncbi:MAG: hypothetical protein AAFR64_08670 [Pseudomonadota bacterium]
MTNILFRSICALTLGFWALTTPAFAAWQKAESERFVIYSDSRPEDLRDLAELLEQFHVAMELETGRRLPAPSPSNRLTVYLVGSIDDLRQVYGNRRSSVGGFYIPRANGSAAFVPNVSMRNSNRGSTGRPAWRARSSDCSGHADPYGQHSGCNTDRSEPSHPRL